MDKALRYVYERKSFDYLTSQFHGYATAKDLERELNLKRESKM